ncbi:TolC family protein [Bradyrhizobium sp.]|jgi:outer membrane protein|uniref:TolC family protein n=1 Tax=Bradyrhizobium sp. TaxID=376 RepID=UPI003455AAA8
MTMGFSYQSILAAGSILVLLACPSGGSAQTLEQALAQAYRNNETLNAERAGLRVTDEEVPQALSGYRPRLEMTADLGKRYLDEKGADDQRQTSTTAPRSIGLSGTQSVFNGFQTSNRVRAAENQVLAGREALRVMEQTVPAGCGNCLHGRATGCRHPGAAKAQP